jgi:hypothetical protein
MEWLNSKIDSLKQIGFFENESNQVLIDRMIRESKTHYYGDILKHENHPDLIYVLTTYDKEITWFTENESYQRENTWVAESGLDLAQEWTLDFIIKYYYEVFKRLEGISKGRFKPVDLQIKECGFCPGIAERLDVNFFLEEKKYNLNFCIDHSKLLLSFLYELNEIVAPTGYSFVHYIERNYTSFFVYFFNKNQKEYFDSIIDYTHDNFQSYCSYWLAKAQYNRDQQKNELAYKCFQKAVEYPENEDTISVISEFATFLIDQGNLNEAKNQYNNGLTMLKNKEVSTERDEWWIMWFGKCLAEMNN